MTANTFQNYCRWNSTTSGTAAFTVGTAADPDASGAHDIPENCGANDGKSYRYYAQSADGLVFEAGRGDYDTATHTLARDEIIYNSDETNVAINFASLPIVDVFPSPPPSLEGGFLAPTRMVFYQAAAPVGWVQVTSSVDDKALRVVSGTGGGAAGSVAFSTLFGRTQVDSHSVSTAELSIHSHPFSDTHVDATVGALYTGVNGQLTGGAGNWVPTEVATGRNTSNSGSGTAHVHGLDMRVTYLDVIVCEKT